MTQMERYIHLIVNQLRLTQMETLTSPRIAYSPSICIIMSHLCILLIQTRFNQINLRLLNQSIVKKQKYLHHQIYKSLKF